MADANIDTQMGPCEGVQENNANGADGNSV